MDKIRKYSVVIMSMLIGSALLKMIEGIGHKINPNLTEIDRNNPQEVIDYASSLNGLPVFFILFAFFIGTASASFLGNWMSKTMQIEHGRLNGFIAAGLLSLYVCIGLIMLPFHPIIINVGAPILCLVGIFIGTVLFGKTIGS